MGTDITMYSERKWNGKWLFQGEPPYAKSGQRGYDLFGQLAGVRRPDERRGRVANPIGSHLTNPYDCAPEKAVVETVEDYGFSVEITARLGLGLDWPIYVATLWDLEQYLVKNPDILDASNPYHDRESNFWTEDMGWLRKCHIHEDCQLRGNRVMARACIEHPEDVRIIFSFDS